MMHVDKNADGYVLDQNVDRISKEIAYVPLSGRIRSKRSSCMQSFFFFFLWETAPSARFYKDVEPNSREWVESCYYLLKWRFD